MTKFKHTPDTLADKLDQALSQGEHQPPTQDDDPLLDAAMRVAQAPKPRLTASAKARIHEQMLQHTPTPPVHRVTFQPLLRWAVAAGIVLVLLLVPTTQITLASVPGDILYPAKHLIETLETSLATTPESQAVVLLQHAQRRSSEANVLLGRGQLNAELIRAAYGHMGQAASIVASHSDFDSNLENSLQEQTIAINAALNDLLVVASQSGLPLAATVTPLVAEIAPTQNGGMLLLPATASPSPTHTTTSPTLTETTPPTIEPSPTLTPSAMPTSTPTATQDMESPTPTATQIVNLIIEGPVEAINDNIITIYGIDVTFDPNDPLLLVLQVGDRIRVNSNIAETIDNTVTITSVDSELVDADIAISEDGATIWRDTNDCSNPPPPWAPANGWRARCESPGGSAPNPGNNNPGNGNAGNNNPNSGNAPGNSGNNGNNPNSGNAPGNSGNNGNNGKSGNSGNNGRGNSGNNN